MSNISKKAQVALEKAGFDSDAIAKVVGTGKDGLVTIADARKAIAATSGSGDSNESTTSSKEDKKTRTKKDARTGRLVQFLPPTSAQKSYPRDGSKTARVFGLFDRSEGATVEEVSDLLKELAGSGNAPTDHAYAKTWTAPSYLVPYGVGICSMTEDNGHLRFWLVRANDKAQRGWDTKAPKKVADALFEACGAREVAKDKAA